jgi:dolichol-phosphate mannosyltransferase
MKLRTAAQAAQAVAAAVVVTRLARGRGMRPPLRATVLPAGSAVSAVIPARDEAGRIGPCVIAALADPGVSEVIVVDDESTDGTATVAARAGARVIPGRRLPPGWVGKQWALQQGLEVASGEYVLTLDADARPRPGLAAALVTAAIGGPFDLVSAGPRFVCDSIAEQGLHAAMLATLVYRFGPIGPARQPSPGRVVVNGQCLLARRAGLAAAGGFEPVRGHLTDDIALARDLARRGWRIGFLDGRDLLDVDMHASVAEVWREWGRSLPMTDVSSPLSQAADLAVLGLTTALPLARLVAGRPTALDAGLLAMRLALVGPLRRCYASPGPGVYLSPLADVAALIRMTGGTIRPVRSWRGRRYPVAPAPLSRAPSAGRPDRAAPSPEPPAGPVPEPPEGRAAQRPGAGGPSGSGQPARPSRTSPRSVTSAHPWPRPRGRG